MAVKEIGSNYLYPTQGDYVSDSRADDTRSKTSHTSEQMDGVSFEKTISSSVAAGLNFIQDLEKQNDGTKFFVGTVSYGQTYGNSSDTNFVVHPQFLNKLGTDDAKRKQFEEDVRYLTDFSKRWREQAAANGQEIISQGWFCDENGNWGGWTVVKNTDRFSVLKDMADNAEKIRQEKLEERKKTEQEMKEHFGDRFKGLSVKLEDAANTEEVVETEAAAETEAAENASEEESATQSGQVSVNVGKTARRIAAAKTTSQLRAVMAIIKSDMQEVEAGIEKGWCDQSELDKVNSLMSMAQNRMGQVEDREATPEEENMFAMASLM